MHGFHGFMLVLPLQSSYSVYLMNCSTPSRSSLPVPPNLVQHPMPLQGILKGRPRPLPSMCERLVQPPNIIRRTLDSLSCHGILIRHSLNVTTLEIFDLDLGTGVKSVNRCSGGFDADFTALTMHGPDERRSSFERRCATEGNGHRGIVVGRERALHVDEIWDVGIDRLEDVA